MNPLLSQRRARQGEEINIAPLIDMVFILLIFFMVSTTFVRDLQLDLERPGASSAVVADTRALRVQVDRRGGLYLDGQVVKPGDSAPVYDGTVIVVAGLQITVKTD